MTEQRKFPDSDPIAIIGMGCRVPGATSPSELWTLIETQQDVRRKIPSERFHVDAFYHPNGKNKGTTNTKFGYFLDQDISEFDSGFFNVSAKEAEAMDPQQRMALEVVYEALENARVPYSTISGSNTSVFCGSFTNDYGKMTDRDMQSYPLHTVTGTGQSIISNRISYFYNLHGESMTIDTACSSSLIGLHLGAQSLKTGGSDMAIIIGTSLHFDPNMFTVMADFGMLSPEGRSRSFDADANGYARGEGVCAVVLKPLSAAKRDGDRVQAVIRATNANHDGLKNGITLPNDIAQEALIRKTYESANLPTKETAFFEAHGTGTSAGDPREARAVGSVFAGDGRQSPLYVGSVKSCIGHLEGAAGLAAVIKATLSIQRGKIMPNMHFAKANPEINFASWMLQVPTKMIDWPSEYTVRRASINSFGYGGSNCHVILEGYEAAPSSEIVRDSGCALGKRPYLIPLSTHSRKAGEKVLARLGLYLQQNPHTDISDLAHTLIWRREMHSVRTYVVAQNTEELSLKLRKGDDLRVWQTTAAVNRIGFVFTGQGAQWAKMGAGLLDSCPTFRDTLEACQVVLDRLPNPPKWSIIDELLKDSNQSRLSEAQFAQPLVTIVQLGLVRQLRDWGITPSATVGHSSGEIAASYASGLISMQDATIIAYYRGLYISRPGGQVPQAGGMLAIGMGENDARDIVKKYHGRLTVAAINSLSSTTISGDLDAILELKDELVGEQTFARQLRVSQAYHSHHMVPLAARYLDALEALEPTGEIDFASCKMSSSVTARVLTAEKVGPEYWADNLVSPVRFSDALAGTVLDERDGKNIDVILEIGPHAALKGPSQDIMSALKVDIPYLGTLRRDQDDLTSLLNCIGELFTLGYPCALSTVNQTSAAKNEYLDNFPSYSWNRSSHWAQTRLTSAYLQRSYHHYLLGSLQPDSTVETRRWRNHLRASEIPWLLDHRIQDKAVFPASAFVSLAVEAAIRESGTSLETICNVTLHDMNIQAALEIPDGERAVEIVMELRRATSQISAEKNHQWQFLLCSFDESGNSKSHCNGYIFLDQGLQAPLEERNRDQSIQLERSTTRVIQSQTFYEHLATSGLQYSGAFKLVDGELEAGPGLAVAHMLAADDQPGVTQLRQSFMDPAFLDAALHPVFAALETKQSRPLQEAYVPTFIQRLEISSLMLGLPAVQNMKGAKVLVSVEDISTRKMTSTNQIYSPSGSDLLVRFDGIELTNVGATANAGDRTPVFQRLRWLPAFSLLGSFPSLEKGFISLPEILDFYGHQYPSSSILHMTPSLSHTKRDVLAVLGSNENRRSRYQMLTVSIEQSSPSTGDFSDLHDENMPAVFFEQPRSEAYDLVVISRPISQDPSVLLKNEGYLLAPSSLNLRPSAILKPAFEHDGICCWIKDKKTTQERETSFHDGLGIIHARSPCRKTLATIALLEREIGQKTHCMSLQELADGNTSLPKNIVVLANLDSAVLYDSASRSVLEFEGVKGLLRMKGKRIVWVLEDSGYRPLNPKHALIHGMLRGIRVENPHSEIITLDMSDTHTDDELLSSIRLVFGDTKPFEDEISVRNGSSYIPRVVIDKSLNRKLPQINGKQRDTEKNPSHRFQPHKTYLLIGGFSGIGMSLTRWMVTKGARNLAILCRSGAHGASVQGLIRWLETRKARCQVYEGDVCDQSFVDRCIGEIGHSLGGVFHAAMVLKDSSMQNMTFDRWTAALMPKVKGLDNIDQATRHIDLEFFICLSSISCITGPENQANYIAGNSYMDALIYRRRSQGLRSATLNIGFVSGVGFVARNKDVLDSSRRRGYYLLNEYELFCQIEEGIAAGKLLDPTTNVGLDTHQIISGAAATSTDASWYHKPLFKILAANKQEQSLEDAQKMTSPHQPTGSLKERMYAASTTAARLDTLFPAFVDHLSLVSGLPSDEIDSNMSLATYGLDSLSAMSTRNWLSTTVDVNVSIFEIFRGQSIKQFLSGIAHSIPWELSPNQEEKEISQHEDRSSVADPIMLPDRPTHIPMSSNQSRFWLMHNIIRDKAHFNLPVVAYLRGSPNADILARAWVTLKEYNEILRTAFVQGERFPEQVLVNNRTDDVSLIDLSEQQDPQKALNDLSTQLRGRELKIGNGETFRLALAKLGPDRWALVMTAHHIICDRGSLASFLSQFTGLYDALTKDLDPRGSVDRPKFQYIDYTLWQNEKLRSSIMAENIKFWRSKLEHLSHVSPLLPFARGKRADFQSFRTSTQQCTLDPPLFGRLKRICGESQATVSHFLLAAFGAFYSRYVGGADLIILLIDGRRPHPDLMSSIGSFVNMIPIHYEGASEERFEELLRNMRDTILECVEHRQVPFDHIVRELGIKPSTSHAPLSQVAFNYQVYGQTHRYQTADFKIESYDIEDVQTACEIQLEAIENSDLGLTFALQASKDLYRSSDALQFLKNFHTFLESIIGDHRQSIDEIPLAGSEEIARIEERYMGSILCESEWDDFDLPLRIAQWATETPDSIALIDSSGAKISYAELVTKARRISASLQSMGVKPGDSIGLMAIPDSDMISGLLGIIFSQCAYVALEPDFGADRQLHMVSDSGISVLLIGNDVVVNESLASSLIRIVAITDALEGTTGASLLKTPEDLPLYITYTSGSTGKPKGVAMRHRNARSMFQAMNSEFAFQSEDRFLLATSLSWDLSVVEIFIPLLAGGTICITSKEARQDPVLLGAFMKSTQTTFTYFTPTQFSMLLRGAPDILRSCIEWRSALFAGETMSSRLLTEFNELRTRATAYNLYGPCEAMVQVTVQNLSGFVSKDLRIPIGRPLGQSRLYVMDPALNLIPDGVVGEICICGPQVGDGYLNRPRESRASFKMEPRLGGEISTGCRLFRTGDLGFFDSNGTLHMVGRKAGDTLVKLRGFRVDLRDVERNILDAGDEDNTSKILDACVVARQNDSSPAEGLGDERHLVAFIVPANSKSVSPQSLVTDLHSRLKPRLGSHMLPSGYHILPALPLTTGGKTDRRHLIQQPVTLIRPRTTKASATHDVSLSNDSILSDVMGHFSATLDLTPDEVFGPNDSFFDMGGQSILLLTLQRRIQQQFEVEITLVDLIRNATPAGVCTLVQRSFSTRESSCVDATITYPLNTGQGPHNTVERVNNCHSDSTSRSHASTEQRVHDGLASHTKDREITASKPCHSKDPLQDTKLNPVRIDWAKETMLPPNDQYHIPMGGPYPFISRQNFMIIGVDSFLGIHLLAELLCNSNAVIYVMGCTDAIGHRHLMHLCRKFDLFALPGVSKELLWSRVRCYPGTITSHRFGLQDEEFEKLGSKIHVIYHLGVVVSALRSYWDLKPLNVRPILDVLELASSGSHVSAIHYVSTASVCHLQSWSTPQGPGVNIATQELPPSLDRPPTDEQNGYIVSRWVGEVLLANAAERGFPVTIHRTPTAVSSTQTQIPPDTGITDRLIQTMLDNSLVPNIKWGDRPMVVDFVPVDILASWLRILSQNPGEPCDSDSPLVIHHLTNPSPLPLGGLAEKIDGQLLDLDDWLSHVLSPLFETGEDELVWSSISHLLQGGHTMFALDRTRAEDALRAAGQFPGCPAVEDDLFRAFSRRVSPFSTQQTPPSTTSSSVSSMASSISDRRAISAQDSDTASSENLIEKESQSPVSAQFTVDRQWFSNLQMASALLAVDAVRKISDIPLSSLSPHHQKLYRLIHQVLEQVPMGHIPGIVPEEWHELVADRTRQEELFKAVEQTDADGALLIRVGSQLPAILSNNLDPFYLFSARDNLLTRFYAECMTRGGVQAQLSDYLCKLRSQTRDLKVLEAGAGTGSLTAQVLEGLCPKGEPAESHAISQFVFTDISPRLFSRAEEHLSPWKNVLDFRELDIGSDVLSQGFASQSFDMIVAANVLHATPNLMETLRNVRTLLKPFGKLLFLEIVRQDLLWVNMTMGTLAGWWMGEEDVRQDCPCVSVDEWNRILARSGFSPIEFEFQSSSSPEFSKFSIMVANAV